MDADGDTQKPAKRNAKSSLIRLSKGTYYFKV